MVDRKSRKINFIETAFARGNRSLREGELQAAILSYRQAINDTPGFSSSIRKNLDFTEKKLLKDIVIKINRLANEGKVLSSAVSEELQNATCAFFDVEWYLTQNQDLSNIVDNLFEHYLKSGRFEGRKARFINPFSDKPPAEIDNYFYSLGYLKENQDVSDSGVEPFGHYVLHGHGEGRAISTAGLGLLYDANTSYDVKIECGKIAGAAGYKYLPLRKPPNLAVILNSLIEKPYFSIVVPVFNTPVGLLTCLYNSLLDQWYPYFELIFVDDASTSPGISEEINKFVDERVRLISLNENCGISEATNHGVAHAKGDYIVFMDHDDELTSNCLYELAICVNSDNPDFIYSDEDKIDQSGKFVEPHFKPAWSPDTLMSTMYVCHVSCVRATILKSIGGLRSIYDGCQDWDLILRVAEVTNRICHIPKVLYHWRILPGSIAESIGAKPYVRNASKNVREDALRRRGLNGTLEELPGRDGYYRVNYHPSGMPLVSIIIPTRDNQKILKICIDSIINNSSYKNLEIVIVNNGSRDSETLKYLHQLDGMYRIRVVRHDIDFNFSELCNVGALKSNGDFLLFLNDDTKVLTADWIERLVGYAQLKHIGAVGAKLLYPNNTVQHVGVLNLENGPGHAFVGNHRFDACYYMRGVIEYNWLCVTAACLIIQREKFMKHDMFDEDFPIAYNDVELCFRLHKSGLFNVVTPAVELIHYESISRGVDHKDGVKSKRLSADRRRLYMKHPSYFQWDPFFSVNLHPNGFNFQLI